MGSTSKVVREGIRHLEAFPKVRVDLYVTRRGRRAIRFHLKLPKNKEQGTVFPLYKPIIEGGNWGHLKPSGRALYPIMRHFGFFDIDLYLEIEDPDGDQGYGDFEEVFRNRTCDYCEADNGILSEFAGISRRSVPETIQDLKRHHLIERILPNDTCISGWKVYLHPPRYYKRSYLNQTWAGLRISLVRYYGTTAPLNASTMSGRIC